MGPSRARAAAARHFPAFSDCFRAGEEEASRNHQMIGAELCDVVYKWIAIVDHVVGAETNLRSKGLPALQVVFVRFFIF